jgi:hypothetical protein
MTSLIKFLCTRDWDVFLLIPPIFSMTLSLVVVPIFDKAWARQIEDVLSNSPARDHLEIFEAISKDRELRLTYLAAWPSFIVTLMVMAKPQNTRALVVVASFLLIIMLALFLVVFSPKLGTNQTRYLFGSTTPHTFLMLVIGILNFLFLILIIANLSAHGTPDSKPLGH